MFAAARSALAFLCSTTRADGPDGGHRLACYVDGVNRSGVTNIRDRIRIEHEQIGALAWLDRSQILRADQLRVGAGGRGQ